MFAEPNKSVGFSEFLKSSDAMHLALQEAVNRILSKLAVTDRTILNQLLKSFPEVHLAAYFEAVNDSTKLCCLSCAVLFCCRLS